VPARVGRRRCRERVGETAGADSSPTPRPAGHRRGHRRTHLAPRVPPVGHGSGRRNRLWRRALSWVTPAAEVGPDRKPLR